MPHKLMKRDVHSAIPEPFLVTARYRCPCATGEILSVAVVIDLDEPEETFLWTMKQLRDDVRFEVLQHLDNGAPPSRKAPPLRSEFKLSDYMK